MDGSFIDKSVTYEAEIIVGFTGELRGHYTVKFFSSTNNAYSKCSGGVTSCGSFSRLKRSAD